MELERFLTTASAPYPTADLLRTAGVSGLAYVRAPTHPERSQLREDFVRTTARHVAVRRAVVPLVAAWRAAAIEVLVFKGFYLAEFEYGSPGERSYYDVDLVIREPDAEAACALAERLGWRTTWRLGQPDHPLAARPPTYAGHEVAQLLHPDVGVTVDLHRRLAHNVHNRRPAARVQQRLTEEAWRASRLEPWLDTAIRVLDPRDAVLLGLAVNRGWGSDGWQLKARDYPDLAAIVERHALTRDDLRSRAVALGVPATLEAFLERCDPFRRVVRLETLGWWRIRIAHARVVRERGWVDVERGAIAAVDGVGAARALGRALPTVWRADRHVAHAAALSTWVRRTGARTETPLGSRTWRVAARAVHRAIRIARVPEERRGAVTTLALFALLRRRGAPVALEGTVSDPVLTFRGDVLDARTPALADD